MNPATPPAWLRLARGTFLDRLADRLLAGAPLVLMYHGVAEDPLDGKFTAFDTFRRQLDVLERHFRIVPLAAVESWRESAAIPRRSIALTFDDGHRNLARTAFPELQRRGLPATVFVTSISLEDPDGLAWPDEVDARVRRSPAEPDPSAWGFARETDRPRLARHIKSRMKGLPGPEKDAWMTRLRATFPLESGDLEPYRLMTAEQIARLPAMGIDVGGHTADHEILSRLDTAAQLEQLERNAVDIDHCTGSRPAHFSYPNGKRADIGPETPGLVRRAGYRLAVTTEEGHVPRGGSPFELPRISAGFFATYDPEEWATALHLRVAVHRLRVR